MRHSWYPGHAAKADNLLDAGFRNRSLQLLQSVSTTETRLMKNKKPERFANDVATVMTLRLSMLPMMWMLDPAKAEKETRKMFSEKEDALHESVRQMMLAPAMFWFDVWQGLLKGDSDGGMQRARQMSEKRISSPYTSRVNANRRRLSRGS